MSYSKISTQLAQYISKDLEFSEEKEEIITYAIETLLLSLLGFAAILLVSYLFNAIIPAATAAIFGGILRRFSGGAHFNSPGKCLAFGTFIYSLIGLLTKQLITYQFINNINILFFLLFISLVLVFLFAPVDSIAKPIHSKKLRIKLRILSILLIFFAFCFILLDISLLVKVSAVLGIMYQSITLLPFLNKRR